MTLGGLRALNAFLPEAAPEEHVPRYCSRFHTLLLPCPPKALQLAALQLPLG